MDKVMVVKKGCAEMKAKNNVGRPNRNKSNVDKNSNFMQTTAPSSSSSSEQNKGKRQERSQILKSNDNSNKENKSEIIRQYVANDGTHYEIDDCVYVDSQRPDVPFFICAIKEFRKCKRECMYVGVKWFYRPSEVPESVYQLLIQDRNTENGSRDHILEDSSVKERELFVSDAVDTYAVTALRGKCRVKCLSEVSCLKEFISHSDHFFYVLRYNPETRRLANHKGEIRVGPSHQVSLPECQPITAENIHLMNKEGEMEELTWRPTLSNYDLMMYIGAARSMAQYAGICKEGDTNKGLTVAARDATTLNAIKVLHDSKYDTAIALQALVKRPFPKTARMNWTDEETKKFVKGLRQFGKNFYKIKTELLPHKQTGELVEYYYIWKKTPSALTSRPHRRRRHNVLRRRNSTRNTKSSSSEFVELSSCSEDEYDSEDSEKDFSLYCCRHCYSTSSKSWHHGGYDRLILCTECLNYFKKYGVMRKIKESREPPPYMFKVVMEKENDEEYYVNGKQLRSRRSTPNISSSLRYGRHKTCSPVDAILTRHSPLPGRKLTRLTKPGSPSAASTESNTSSSSSNKKQTKRRKNKRTENVLCENVLPPKRKKSVTRESDDEEEGTDQSEQISSPPAETESVTMEADVTSVSSNASQCNEEARTSPSPEILELPERDADLGKFPARKILYGQCCARTGLPFIWTKKPVFIVEDTKQGTEKKPKKTEPEQTSSIQKSRTPTETITSSTSMSTSSHHDHLRKYMAAAAAAAASTPCNAAFPRSFPGISSFPIPAAPLMPVSLLGHGEQPMFPWQLYPGVKELPKDHDSWYSQYKLSRAHPNSSHAFPPSLLHSVPLLENQRASPLHRNKDGILIPGLPAPLPGDPGHPHHHSHSHVHTHYHLHPGEQHPPHSPSLNLEPNLLWRTPHSTPGHEMWPPQHALTSHPRHMIAAGVDELNGVPPYFPGLYPPPTREYQLQHEIMLNQGIKMDHVYPFYPPLLSSREHHMRFSRPHDRSPRIDTELRRLEAGEEPSGILHRADSRSMRSPLIKNYEPPPPPSLIPSSGHKQPVTIDLSKDD